jgi:hypothetical protein
MLGYGSTMSSIKAGAKCCRPESILSVQRPVNLHVLAACHKYQEFRPASTLIVHTLRRSLLAPSYVAATSRVESAMKEQYPHNHVGWSSRTGIVIVQHLKIFPRVSGGYFPTFFSRR